MMMMALVIIIIIVKVGSTTSVLSGCSVRHY